MITKAPHPAPVPATPGLGSQLGFVEEVPLAGVAEQAGFTRVTVGDNMTGRFARPGTVADLTGERFVLGLGAMPRHWSEDHHGVDHAHPVARVRYYIAAIRACWSGTPERPVDHEGAFYRLRGYSPLAQPSQYRIPITLGVIRPPWTRLATAGTAPARAA